ncbi:hypothetical protein K461DRAFT_280513 [Myriangium duriaei CBS 260.36]|uniref:Uncharacterized protein n=1 Tax=Myriangium duriaei CBS 260.36 TaxID=1168546 RepID=A0A9P4J162_9PEZI|nr:hypothetical protein K461DRAFT_280513 [Myriangium duriaei CBS 260.36]
MSNLIRWALRQLLSSPCRRLSRTLVAQTAPSQGLHDCVNEEEGRAWSGEATSAVCHEHPVRPVSVRPHHMASHVPSNVSWVVPGRPAFASRALFIPRVLSVPNLNPRS